MDIQQILDSASGSQAISTLLMIITGAMTVVFVIAFASFIYHWHYYGIGFLRRWALIIVFGGVGAALLVSAYGLMLKLI